MKGLIAIPTLLGLWAALAATGADTVETIEARCLSGKVLSVTSKEVTVELAGRKQSLPRSDVAEIAFAEAETFMDRRGQSVLVTTAGDLLSARGLSIANGKVIFDSPLLGKTELAVSSTSAFYMPDAKRTPAQIRATCRELKIGNSPRDVLLVEKTPGSYLRAMGVLKAMNHSRITFTWKDQDRTITRRTVPAIRMAAVGNAAAPKGGVLTGRSGSTLAFSSLTMDADNVVLESPALAKQTIPRGRIASLRLTSSRVVDLATLKPSSVREQGFFGPASFVHRVNRSVGGGGLALGGRTYRTGLGLHSFCELTYELDGAYSRFVAVVGIDDAVHPAGDATVTFLADQKPLGKDIRVRGRAAPQTVRLDIKGAKTLTIRVGFGADELDVSDHVDIAIPRLIK